MEDKQQPEKLPGSASDLIKAVGDAYEAVEALEVLDVFRSLSDRERDRVYKFTQDAQGRESDPKQELAYLALESFWLFVGWYRKGDSMDEICRCLDLTKEQYGRYVRAWAIIQAVEEEAARKVDSELAVQDA